MRERAFDPVAFYARVGATAKERAALRQDLVRGLKDYYEHSFGYDRYGAETVFMVPEAMSQPYVFGFALRRILHDRRISDAVKIEASTMALESIAYGQDMGLPFGVYGALDFLASVRRLTEGDLRYALVVTAGDVDPFRGVEKPAALRFFRSLLGISSLPGAERLFWAHSLIARHQDQPGASELIASLMSQDDLPREDREELCWAWLHFRQPRLEVSVPSASGDLRSDFVVAHMPFWISHSPSWPTGAMIKQALVWLARLGEDPLMLVESYIEYRAAFAEQVHGGVGDIIAEHHGAIPPSTLKSVIERGIGMSGSIATRRRFYRLGSDLFGPTYLERATEDTAGSVRQWAARQLQRQS